MFGRNLHNAMTISAILSIFTVTVDKFQWLLCSSPVHVMLHYGSESCLCIHFDTLRRSLQSLLFSSLITMSINNTKCQTLLSFNSLTRFLKSSLTTIA